MAKKYSFCDDDDIMEAIDNAPDDDTEEEDSRLNEDGEYVEDENDTDDVDYEAGKNPLAGKKKVKVEDIDEEALRLASEGAKKKDYGDFHVICANYKEGQKQVDDIVNALFEMMKGNIVELILTEYAQVWKLFPSSLITKIKKGIELGYLEYDGTKDPVEFIFPFIDKTVSRFLVEATTVKIRKEAVPETWSFDYNSSNPSAAEFFKPHKEFMKAERLLKSAKDAAFSGLQGFVAYICLHNYHTYCQKDFFDMLQCGYMGILTGLPKYNPDQYMPTTFFKTYIKCEICKYITYYKRNSTLHYANTLTKIEAAKKHFDSLGIPYTASSIAEYCDISLITVQTALESKEMSVSVNYQDALKNTSTASPKVSLPNVVAADPETCLIDSDLKQAIAQAISKLSPEEQQIIYMSFGFNGKIYNDKTIAKMLDLSTNAVKTKRQIAFNKLRDSGLRNYASDKYQLPSWLDEEVSFFPGEGDDTSDKNSVVIDLDNIIFEDMPLNFHA